MRSVSSRAPSMRCVGASDEMIQLSTTEPMLEPMKPPMVAALTPRIAPPIAAANGGAGRAENEGGHFGIQTVKIEMRALTERQTPECAKVGCDLGKESRRPLGRH